MSTHIPKGSESMSQNFFFKVKITLPNNSKIRMFLVLRHVHLFPRKPIIFKLKNCHRQRICWKRDSYFARFCKYISGCSTAHLRARRNSCGPYLLKSCDSTYKSRFPTSLRAKVKRNGSHFPIKAGMHSPVHLSLCSHLIYVDHLTPGLLHYMPTWSYRHLTSQTLGYTFQCYIRGLFKLTRNGLATIPLQLSIRQHVENGITLEPFWGLAEGEIKNSERYF